MTFEANSFCFTSSFNLLYSISFNSRDVLIAPERERGRESCVYV